MTKLTADEIRIIAKEIFIINKNKRDIVAKFSSGRTMRHVWHPSEESRNVRLGNRSFDLSTVRDESYISVFIAPEAGSTNVFIDIGDFPIELAWTAKQTNDIIRVLTEAVKYAKEMEKEINKVNELGI